MEAKLDLAEYLKAIEVLVGAREKSDKESVSVAQDYADDEVWKEPCERRGLSGGG